MNKSAIIFGIKGYKLTNKEKKLFKKTKPWGIILFSRNIRDIHQLENLINEIRKTLNEKKYPILIDEEGGKVSRLKKIIDLSTFSQNYFSKLFKSDKKLFYIVYKKYIDVICDIFKSVGININIAPVLDVRRKKSHNIIGNRSFSENPKTVVQMGRLCVDFYEKNKIATVIKHIPGHGLSKCDSHFKMPKITASKSELKKKDFLPFKYCPSFFAMTCHAVYNSYDRGNSATHSKIIISKVIRSHINFKGILISDDISMKSLKYKLEKNALKALNAGCNLVLHCNGNIKEMNRLSKVVPKIDKFTQKKTSHFYKFLG